MRCICVAQNSTIHAPATQNISKLAHCHVISTANYLIEKNHILLTNARISKNKKYLILPNILQASDIMLLDMNRAPHFRTHSSTFLRNKMMSNCFRRKSDSGLVKVRANHTCKPCGRFLMSVAHSLDNRSHTSAVIAIANHVIASSIEISFSPNQIFFWP